MKQFITIVLIVFFPIDIFAYPVFSSFLPNPAGDDTLGEYIEIYNPGCKSIDIGGYEVRDLQKGYVFPAGTLMEPRSYLKLEYKTSKISLNNSGLETITLMNSSGSIINSYSYSGTQKDSVVLHIATVDEMCDISTPIESTGSIDDIHSELTNSGSILQDESTGAIWTENTGGTLSGEIILLNQSGSESTGSTIIEGLMNIHSSGSEFTSSGSGEVVEGIISNSGMIESNTGAILESTGVIISSGTSLGSSGMNLSGGIILPTESGSSINAGSVSGNSSSYIETGALIPLELYYSDEDANNRIDTLEIMYPYVLTGIVNTGAIFLYSRSGGLSSAKIDTEMGYILSGSLSGSSLILTIKEGDIDKLELHITNSTNSDLRLKSTGDLGFRSLGGQIPEAFFLTSSFDDYENVIYKEYVYESEEMVSGTGEELLPDIVFPDIVPTLQSPTNATFSSGVFICTETVCRINITFVPIFSGSFFLSDYICSIGTGEILNVDDDCNPTTYYYSSSGTITVELISRKVPEEKVRKSFPVTWSYGLQGGTEGELGEKTDANPPIIILKHDGKWHSYYRQISDYELDCYTMTCAINLTAESSYDREGSPIRYMWMYDMGELSTKKDPGEKKFGPGDHVIWLRVIDVYENMSEIFFYLHVLGETKKSEKIILEKKPRVRTSSVILDKTKKGKKKMKKLSFFDPPEIILQNKDSKTRKYQDFTCVTTAKNCGFNLSLANTQRNIIYTWTYSDGTSITSKNPRSKILSPGRHIIFVTASYGVGDTPLWSEAIELTVKSVKKAKKKKEVKSKKDKKEKVIPKKDKKEEIIPFLSPGENQIMPFNFIFLILGVGIVFIFRRKLYPRLSTFREQDADTET